MTTLREIADGLPNGFHDARVDVCTVDFGARTVTFELAIWLGDDKVPERYRGARLRVVGLLYCAFDLPDQRYPFAARGPLVVDLCDPDPAIAVNAALPPDAFSARFWVGSWNAFIHLAATGAELAWTDATSQPDERPDVTSHCCERMKSALGGRCTQHADPFDCPDTLLTYYAKFDEYGLLVHDGGRSVVQILFCPWCGQRLRNSKRDLWFDELALRGFHDPLAEPIPSEFESDRWWRGPS